MKNVYEVRYETKYSGVRDWFSDSKRVLANGDATHAIAVVRDAAMKEAFEDITKSGKVVNRKVVKFRLQSVGLITHIDL